MISKECKARVYGDQFHCHHCGLVWDLNDKEPPACGIVDHKENAERLIRRLDANVYTLVLDGKTELRFKAEWMARAALEKALDGYFNGSYDLEPVLVGPDGQEVKL